MRSLPLSLAKKTTARPSEIVLQPQQGTEAETAWKPFAGLAKALVATALDELYNEEVVHDIEFDNLSDYDDVSECCEGPEEVFDLVEEQEMHWLDIVLADVGFMDQAEAVSVETLDINEKEPEQQNEEPALAAASAGPITEPSDVVAVPQSQASDIFCTASRTFMLSEKPAQGSEAGPHARRSSKAGTSVGTPSNRHRRTIYGAVVRAAAPEELLSISGKLPSGRKSSLQTPFRMDADEPSSASWRESSFAISYEDMLGSQAPADPHRRLSAAHLLHLSVRPGQRSAGLQPLGSLDHSQGPQQPVQKLKASLSPVQRPVRPPGTGSRPQSRGSRTTAMQLDLGLPMSPGTPLAASSTHCALKPRKVASVPSLQALNTVGFAATKSNKLSMSTGLLPPLKSDRSVKGTTVEWTTWDVQAGRRRRGLVF